VATGGDRDVELDPVGVGGYRRDPGGHRLGVLGPLVLVERESAQPS